MGEVSPKQMRITQAAGEYSIPVATLQRMCQTRKVRASKVGKCWYVTGKAMDDLFKKGENIR